jgi:hypothetical protein
MTTLTQPHRTRGHRPGYWPIALTDITIRIQATPGIDVEVWRALHTDVDAAVDASLRKYGLAGARRAIAAERSVRDATGACQGSWERNS